MNSTRTGINMTIDVKKNRFRIFKSTMHMLGDPTYVQLLFNPTDDIIMIRAAKRQTPGGQELRIHQSKPGSDGSYDMYSMSFVQRIRAVYPQMQEPGSYRLAGESVPREQMVFFPMSTLEKVEV